MSQFTLFSNQNVLLLQSNKPNHPILKISRPSAEISLLSANDFSVTSFGPFDSSIRCFGIYGMVELLAGKYLIVVTGQSFIGTFPGSEGDVRQITAVKILSCGAEISTLSPQLQADEHEFLGLLEAALNQSAPMASGLYYSPTVPLSRSLQSQFQQSPHQFKYDAINGTDTFAVNAVHLSHFASIAIVEIRDLIVNRHKITFALISRRNVARTGARYHCRGIDSQGNVANFVETEQIICTPEGRCASFLQIRGSIPLFWRQNVRIKYKPELEIVSTTHHEPAFLLHRDSTLKAYKQVSVVNLVDSHGGEARLSTVFHKLSNNPQQDWKYTEFDFHAECRNMAYHNIAKLVKQLESDLNAHGYFEGHLKQQENKSDSDNFTIRGQILKTQNGIVRTNCMDCLDRTNVVQSVLARRALLAQFKDFEIVPSETGEDFGPFGDAMVGIFRNVWADNADAISTQYSGTGALKTDFTRTGKRSPMGALQDGINSALRYYFGNFTDGHRQDALNLLFGAYKVSPSNYSSPFSNSPSDPIKIILLWALILLILLFFLSAHFNYNSGLILSASLIVAILHYIRNNGKRFTQKPRLIQMGDQDKKNN